MTVWKNGSLTTTTVNKKAALYSTALREFTTRNQSILTNDLNRVCFKCLMTILTKS